MSNQYKFIDDNGNTYSEWEEKKLGEILTEPLQLPVKDTSKMELLTVKLYTKGIVRTGKCPNQTTSARPYYARAVGELLVGRQNFHNGGMGLVDEESNGLIASNAISSYIIKEPQNYSLEYVYIFISREEFYKKVDHLIGGTGQKELSKSEFSKLKIQIPSLSEQEKIAEFFSALDERIALTADKVKLLKEQKQGYLQQVFNRKPMFTDENGDAFPEWEAKKLDELFNIKSSGDVDFNLFSKERTEEFKYPVFGNATSQKGIFGYYKTFDYSAPAITITGRGANVGTPFERKESFSAVGRLLVLIPKEQDISTTFFTDIISKVAIINESTGVPQLTAPAIGRYEVMVPFLPEQEKIAEFFSALDEQIELTENKLTLLKEQKKGYLQGIFG